jgi:hypothetical protein
MRAGRKATGDRAAKFAAGGAGGCSTTRRWQSVKSPPLGEGRRLTDSETKTKKLVDFA